MQVEPTIVTIALPIADRRRSYEFYRSGLGFTTPGEPDRDGVPEPLRLTLGDHVRVMLIPKVGFGWVLSGRKQATAGRSECVVSLSLPTRADVDDLLARAERAGAEIVRPSGEQDWGYDGAFADPDGHVWHIALAGEFMTSWP
ncbi:VOC family protein [Kribbella sp. NPDC049227]|uniref:VOC family protein n=1 Tax=Kribbella sp. NPDC049227 TaxID=3364113 RepID=UPI003716A756